jgi:osmotically-inducible protein OsmY
MGSAYATAYPGSPVAASYGSSSATPWYNTDIPYGTAMYNITNASGTVSTSGFASAGLSNSSSVTVTTGRFGGANSYGIRRSPSYTTGIAFDYTPRPVAAVRPDIERALNSSSRLPSGGSIRVVMDGKTVVLRGRVATARERRLAEAMARLTPGVRDVRNEIEAPESRGRSGP